MYVCSCLFPFCTLLSLFAHRTTQESDVAVSVSATGLKGEAPPFRGATGGAVGIGG